MGHWVLIIATYFATEGGWPTTINSVTIHDFDTEAACTVAGKQAQIMGGSERSLTPLVRYTCMSIDKL